MVFRDSPELVWRTAGFVALGVTVVGSLTPGVSPGAAPFADKLLHVFVYALIAALFARGAIGRMNAMAWALGAAAAGLLLEGLQAFTGRDPSLTDALANFAGALIGGAAAGRGGLPPRRSSSGDEGDERADAGPQTGGGHPVQEATR